MKAFLYRVCAIFFSHFVLYPDYRISFFIPLAFRFADYTTLKVLDNQEKFVDNINFKGWVLTVMRNIFINNYHKIVRTQTVVDQGVDLYNLDVVNDSGFDSPDGAYQIQEITKAINGLNNELKVPFSMFLSGYKYNEIADKLDVPLGTVKSRIFFARQELQKVLKDFRQG